MDALAGYGSDDSDVDERVSPRPAQPASTTLAEPLEYDPSDAFGLNSLRSDSTVAAQTPTQDPPAQRADTNSRGARSTKKKGASSDAAATAPAASTSASASVGTVALAPDVIDNSSAAEALLLRPDDSTMHVNIRYADMTAAQLGPENPFASHAQRHLGAQQNTLTGHVETAAVSDYDFRNQQRTFHVYGYARDPSLLASSGEAQYIGDQAAAASMGGASAADIRAGHASFRPATRSLRRKRGAGAGDASIVEGDGAYVGPWAKWQGDEDVATQLLGGVSGVGPSEAEVVAAQAEADERAREKEAAASARKQAEKVETVTETSIFHGKSRYDYQGRTYMHVPTDVDVNLSGEAGEQECYLPKTCIHTFRGHTKGVSTIKLLPRTGHLLLSASLDGTVKLWDVYHQRECLRTFMGHSKAVRDIAFSNDGRRFLSAGYDRQVKLWDTETGACLDSFTNGKTAYCVTFHPDEDKQHLFLAGMSDKKVVQWDTNTHTVTQEYTSHLGPVNTVTFVDQNRRFVTTSDDKTMRGWDFDIPVVIKYIADPSMHSMPAVTVSPSQKWMAAQSMDNQILTFATDGFKQNRKKVFKGHNVAGFACQVGFSPDGKFLSSGDADGNLCFWDWKSTRLLKRIRNAHREAVIAHAWLPHESSKIVTASWDGDIKLWD